MQSFQGVAGRPAGSLSAVAFIVVAVLCFGALDTTTKVVAATVPVLMVLWCRYLVQAALTGLLLWPARRSRLFRTTRPLLQVVRGVLLLTCSAIAVISLRYMPVGEFTAIVMLTPLVLTVVAALTLHERVSWLRWACVLGGFVGSMIVIRPGEDLFHWAMLLPLVLVAANTGFQVLTSRMARTEDPGTMHFYTGLVGLLLTTLGLPFAWQLLPPGLWLLVGLLGVLGTIGHFLLILAFRRAPVAELTPFLYLQIAFATLGGWLVFGHVPDDPSLTGIALVTVSGVIGTWLTGREAAAASRRDAAESSLSAIAGADVH
jgi:drug/metabolite transporter (DMT)-like permease